jgi:hypothetical protein
LIAQAQAEGLSDQVPDEIEAEVADWDFDVALSQLDEKEEALNDYLGLKGEIASLRTGVQEAGLTLNGDLDAAIENWEFDRAAAIVNDAEAALARYLAARERVDEPRSLWERFGLLGADPDGKVKDSSEAFNSGDYERSRSSADEAVDTVDSASSNAARRVLIVAGGAAAFAIVILLVVWFTRLRERNEPA